MPAWESQRDQARASVDSVKYHVQANERIINSNDIVTAQVRDRLVALQQAFIDRGELDRAAFSRILGQVLTNGLVVAVF